MVFESHVTIEPVFDEEFLEFENCCNNYQFKPAELLLQKSRKVTAERSNRDSFCTGHSDNYEELLNRTLLLVNDLKESNFQVWRYKIEQTLLDVRTPPLVKLKG